MSELTERIEDIIRKRVMVFKDENDAAAIMLSLLMFVIPDTAREIATMIENEKEVIK